MSSKILLNACVRTMCREAIGINSVELVPEPGAHFPEFSPGSHIDLHLPNGLVRNYSLCNSYHEKDRYVLGILQDSRSRGGSKYIHEALRCGAFLRISEPRNNFALDEAAASTVLVAGGIGITPILSMFRRLRELGAPVRLIYCTRSRGQAAFLDEIEKLGGDVQLHFDDENDGKPVELRSAFASTLSGVHAYCCGPEAMLNAFEVACGQTGIEHVHVERFAANAALHAATGGGFNVELARSGRTLEVSEGKSILHALLDAGVDVDHSCEEGVCGACETRVLSGCPDHRDSVLNVEQRSGNKVMMVCVSGVKSGKLVLDL
ncbi:PDR/VanB family oxidoreductase [Paraburkholderia silvatlantica]|uniref:PDR/VanB family oxidoreductase n=1 Tax=Paraburkholderia silvatlantica TaxID=321895 RepID=UPI0037530CC5